MEPPPFSGQSIDTYAEGPPRQVPGFLALQRMTTMLLAERTPANGRVLVLGAGGGLELNAFAEAHPGWSFDGVAPSADMLRLAAQMVRPYGDRIRLHQGYIESAPVGLFDAATSLLTFHFIPRDQRLETLKQLHCRLKPGAPFVVAHISFPQTEPERSVESSTCRLRSARRDGFRSAGKLAACHRHETLDTGAGRRRGHAARGRLLKRQPVLCRPQLQRVVVLCWLGLGCSGCDPFCPL